MSEKEMGNSHRIEEFLSGISKKLDNLESIDKRLETMDTRFESIDKRLETMDTRLESIDKRLETMDTRLILVEKVLQGVVLRLNWLEDNFKLIINEFERTREAYQEGFKGLSIRLEKSMNALVEKIIDQRYNRLDERITVLENERRN